MTVTDDRQRGLYGKYQVHRAKIEYGPPGTTKQTFSPPGGPVFVLAYESDPHAAVALQTYGKELPAAIDENRKGWHVERHDGKAKGPYFVLAYMTDARALDALKAYAASCRADYPLLADDLDHEVARAEAMWGDR